MKNSGSIRQRLTSKAVLLLGFTIILVIVLCIIRPNITAQGNIRGVLNNLCVQGTIMAGLATLLISGGIDLSSGAQAGFASLVFALLLKAVPTLPWPVAFLAAMLFGVCAGLINIFLVNKLNLMPFIATIGMSSVYLGIANTLTRGNTVPISNQSFINLGKIAFFGRIPFWFVVTAVILTVYAFMLQYTAFGRNIYMVGGNRNAARLAGLNHKKIHGLLFINNSVIASVAGLMWASQRKMSSASSLISNVPDMNAITSAILGGVGFMGGSGGLGGACVGMLLLNIFDNGLTVLKVSPYWNIFAQGMLLIIALIIDHFSANKHTGGGSPMGST
jgi:ribose transport system permease protein